MTTKQFAFAVLTVLLAGSPGRSQTASDLLQKGIHLQEAAGDIDGAIQFFRQVVTSATTNKPLAAQAQYQLILCMLQKGDRAAATKELAALEHNFAEMPDMVAKARKLIPGTGALLAAPWGEAEYAQLNIKRDGQFTGEYLYYSIESVNDQRGWASLVTSLRWELQTRKSKRTIQLLAEQETLRPGERPQGPPDNRRALPVYESDDELGDASAAPFTGPATDAEQTIFLLRRLPLAVGYKTSLPVTSDTIAPVQMELTVTGIESVQTVAGKFNCYKLSFPAVRQTFWIGAEGTRPLVKFQNGVVEAELVKMWGPENPLDSFNAAVKAAGGSVRELQFLPFLGGNQENVHLPGLDTAATVTLIRRYTPQAEIAEFLQKQIAPQLGLGSDQKPVLPPETRTIGGHPALSLIDHTHYIVWIGSESAIVRVEPSGSLVNTGTFRWRFEPFLAAIRIP